MLSAPAAMPATRQPIFASGFAPQAPAGRTREARSCSPARAARAMTGTSPACDTRFGSSKAALVRATVCDNRTCEVSSRAWATAA